MEGLGCVAAGAHRACKQLFLLLDVWGKPWAVTSGVVSQQMEPWEMWVRVALWSGVWWTGRWEKSGCVVTRWGERKQETREVLITITHHTTLFCNLRGCSRDCRGCYDPPPGALIPVRSLPFQCEWHLSLPYFLPATRKTKGHGASLMWFLRYVRPHSHSLHCSHQHTRLLTLSVFVGGFGEISHHESYNCKELNVTGKHMRLKGDF